MSKSQKGSTNDLTSVEGVKNGGEGEFIQVKKKSDKTDPNKGATDKKNGEEEFTKKKSKSRSRNNSIGEGKPSKARSRNNSANYGKTSRADGKNFSKSQKNKHNRKTAKANRDYENEEWRTVYIGFIERGTSEAELALHFKDSGEIERLTLKDGFAFILFKKEASVTLACKLDGTCLNGLNLRVAPRKEKPPEVAGDILLDLDMKKFRHEKHPKVLDDVEDFLQGFECVGSFSQDKKEPNSIVIPGCPPVLDWKKMEAEEGEITLSRQAENAPELNTTDSIFKSVSLCSPEVDFSTVDIVTNRQCLMKLLAPVDPSIMYTTNKCFRMSCAKSPKGPLFLNLEAKWHPTMGTAKSFQDSITMPLPEMVKNIAFPGIFYRINQFSLGKVNVMVRTQVHAEDEEPMLEFEEDLDAVINEDVGDDEDFFDIEEREPENKDKKDNKIEENGSADKDAKKLSVNAAEWVPPVRIWNKYEKTDMKWIKNDQVFCQPESRYEVKTVDIAGNFWEYNAEKTFYQMLLGGVDYLLLGVLLNNEYVINKEEYDLSEVHTKVLGTKNPTDATLVLSKMERILSKMVELSKDLAEDEKLELVFDGRNEHLTFFKVKVSAS